MVSLCSTAVCVWALSLMQVLQPEAPWKATYENTANAIVSIAVEHPLNLADKPIERTIALLVSLSWFESRFDPNAHNSKDPGGGSYGLYQASRKPLASVEEDTENALQLIRQSFKLCTGLPPDKLLSWYTTGGPKCFPTKESTHRMALANRLLKEHPAP